MMSTTVDCGWSLPKWVLCLTTDDLSDHYCLLKSTGKSLPIPGYFRHRIRCQSLALGAWIEERKIWHDG